jgi:uncharacterized membrane protein
MWTRLELKEKAKVTLKKYYWQLLVVVLVLAIVGSTHSPRLRLDPNHHSFSIQLNGKVSDQAPQIGLFSITKTRYINNGISDFYTLSSFTKALNIFVMSGTLFILLASVLFRVLLGYPLEIGCLKFCLNASEEKHSFSDLKLYFNKNHYWNLIKTMYLRFILTCLWLLALYIPGIIKCYAYSMVPYILADNPDMPPMQAIKLSENMTQGHKWNIFILGLSFLGWFILGMLLCGIGVFLVEPYFLMTQAELYKVLRSNAIENKFCTAADLNLPEVELVY